MFALKAMNGVVPGFEKAKLRNFGSTIGTRDSRKIIMMYDDDDVDDDDDAGRSSGATTSPRRTLDPRPSLMTPSGSSRSSLTGDILPSLPKLETSDSVSW